MPIIPLADRLALLRQPSTIPDVDDLEEEEAAEEQIEYSSKYEYIQPSEELFLALHTPYLLHPLDFNWFNNREFMLYMLGGYSYVTGQEKLDTDRIFNLYLKAFPTAGLEDCQQLIYFCHHIRVVIPAIYQARIEALIQSIKS